MSSLYLCRDCDGSFHSLEELQSHELAEHREHVVDVLMEEEHENEQTMPEIKIEEDALSDTDSSTTHSVLLATTTDKSCSSGEKARYECEDCHELFAVKRELATHMRIHSGEQPHSCTQCGKEFGTRQLLKKHWMWHTGERSHVCPHCNKAFFQKGHLTQHLMIHSGGRPHECPQCHKTFIFKFDLNRHMKIHQERGFSCLQCGRSFLKQSMLDEHHLKCKGKPSSPIRSLLTPTMKAGLENAFQSVKPSAETLLLTPETIAKMAQKLLVQQQQQQQETQRNAFSTLLVKHETNNNEQTAFESPLNLTCMMCKTSFANQSSFTLHMYMYHLTSHHQSPSSTLLSLPAYSATSSAAAPASEPSQLGSDADPATDTSCASSPQKTSPLQLESSSSSSCLEQSSVSPSSSSGASPQPTASESSSTSSSCKDCSSSWQRVHDLEQQVLQKDEQFEKYRQMTRQLVANVTNLLSTASPDNIFMMNAASVMHQLKHTL